MTRRISKEQAKAEGYTVDTCCYPHFGYKGLRFNGAETNFVHVYTDLEWELMEKLRPAEQRPDGIAGPLEEGFCQVCGVYECLDHVDVPTYQVIVGGIGTVHDSFDRRAAEDCYFEYVTRSSTGYGRAAGEPVTLTQDGEPIREHTGTIESDEESEPMTRENQRVVPFLDELKIEDSLVPHRRGQLYRMAHDHIRDLKGQLAACVEEMGQMEKMLRDDMRFMEVLKDSREILGKELNDHPVLLLML